MRLRSISGLLLAMAIAGCSEGLTGPEKALSLYLHIPSTTVKSGESLALEFRLTNISDRDVELELMCQPWHVEVYSSDGKAYYRSHTTMQFDCAQSFRIAPGETVTQAGTWAAKDWDTGDPAPAGTYNIRSSFRQGVSKPLAESGVTAIIVTP